MLALGVGFILLLVVTAAVDPVRRRLVGLILLTLAVAFPPYYLKFQHSSGTLATPARATASNFTPDPRDAASRLRGELRAARREDQRADWILFDPPSLGP